MKKVTLIFVAVSLLMLSGCSKRNDAISMFTEDLPVQSGTEMFSFEVETDTEKSCYEEKPSVIVDDPAELNLQYIPELGYCKSIEGGGIYRENSYVRKSTYACWKDWLILGDEVYKRQENGFYKRIGDHYLCEMIGVKYLYDLKQCKNLIIMNDQMQENFCVFNLDTGEKKEMSDLEEKPGKDFEWHLFNGNIYYRPEDKKSIWKLDLLSGKDEEFYRLDEKKGKTYDIDGFSIREDGIVMAVLCDLQELQDNHSSDSISENIPCHYEFWCIGTGEDRFLEKKAGETNAYITLTCLGYNQYGFFLNGTYPTSDGRHCLDEYIYLTEDGSVKKLYPAGESEQFYLTEGGYYLLNGAGTVPGITSNISRVYSVSKYNLDSSYLKSYRLIEESMLAKGWYMLDIIIYNGQATAFYANESEDYLYISQVSLE